MTEYLDKCNWNNVLEHRFPDLPIFHRPLTMGSLFDGIGGFPLAACHAGVIPLWASEIEQFPIDVTKRRFEFLMHVGDITKLDGAKLPPVDILCGGSPCQDLSVAGARAGLAGERSGLFMEQVRLAKEMRNADILRGRSGVHIRPRYFIWENVPGAFSSGSPKGEDFRIVLEEVVGISCDSIPVPRPHTGKWQPAGRIILGDSFSLAWRCLDAQYWGVAQRRKRIFLMADLGGPTAPEILFDGKGLFRNLEASRRAREGTSGTTERSSGSASWTAPDANTPVNG